ncbi:hypothetical protein IRP63_15005 (plasmid) [Clostridium botulinum]|uniref:Uncharacterized protein n=1 Tax=Clostridium botulinum C/D str. DC5 TaxID=1443128 RepID=A0A0A0HXX0_CLOBO|nr:hypothetical protein [Clostridium botulinum]KGM93392.1 hypothetical protein Z955_15620 [Clostridium botulinum C/D str. DC5]KOC56924.1 hypothetical protein ADU89_01650 [Clostridium botulinum]KOC57399.1 hypothetical protein ADU90_06190 [Clostridium botulinum]MCD3232636.1 hypothetical protein [Clostridium botulinum D/C]MCD3238435.1 hypothetical protein [Clostridium botulinum D/C]
MLNRCKTYEFSKKGWEQAKQDSKKIKNNRVMDLIVYSTLLGLTVGNIVKNDTLLKIIACDGTKRVVKTLIIH